MKPILAYLSKLLPASFISLIMTICTYYLLTFAGNDDIARSMIMFIILTAILFLACSISFFKQANKQ